MQKFFEKDEIDLSDYLKILIRRKKTFFTVFIAYIFIITIVIALLPREYEAAAIIRIGGIDKSFLSKAWAEEEIKSLKNIANAAQLKNLDIDIFELRGKISIDDNYSGKDNFIRVKVRQANPELAIEICNALADTFVAEGNKIYDKEIVRYEEDLKKLEKSKFANDKENVSAFKKKLISSENFEVFSPAILPRQSIQLSNSPDTIVLLFFTGLVLSLFAVSFQEFWQRNKEVS